MIRGFALTLALAIPVCAGEAAAQAPRAIAFNIAAQPLESALVQLASQGGFAISLPPSGFGALRGKAVSGVFTAEQAISRVLDASGFAFKRVGADAYTIEPIARGPAPIRPGIAPFEPTDTVVVSARIEAPEAEMAREVTRIDGERLAAADMHSDAALVGEVAGLSFTNLGAGRNKILLRGVSDGALTGRTQSLVGLYLDDTRLTYGAPDPDIQLVDMQSVEVLRGPQGALYGAGAMGGIVRLSTRPVDLKGASGSMLASLEGTQGGGSGSNIELVGNLPIVADTLGLRGSFWSETTGGWLDNPVIGARDTNRTQRTGWRLSGLARISPHWTISATALGQSINSDDSQYASATSPDGQRDAAMLEPHDNDFAMLNVTIKGETPWGDLVSSTSRVKHAFDSRYDATGAFSGFGVTPGAIQPIDEADSLHILVHETRLTSISKETPWFIGLFYADGDSTKDVLLQDGPYGAWNRIDYSEARIDKIDELAIFGEVTWRLTPKLSLAAGARIFRSTLATDSHTSEPLRGLSATFAGRQSNSGFAPDLRLSWRPESNLLFYLSAARGYRGGGFNTGEPVDQALSAARQPFRSYSGDEIWTYEIGARLDLLDDRLALRITGFDSDWRGVQTDELIASGFAFTGNVGNARATGAEFEARYEPIDDLIFRLSGLINEPEINQPNASYPQATNGSLPGSPEYSVAASVRHERDVMTWGLDARGFAELGVSAIGPSIVGFGGGSPAGDYALLYAGAGLRLDDWDVSLQADNITGSDGPTYSFGNPYQPGKTLFTPLRPRSVRVTVRRNF